MSAEPIVVEQRDNLPAVSSAGVPAVSGPPGPLEWQAMKEQSRILVASNFLPRAVDSEEKALAIMLKGRELALPPMQAFAHVHIVEGKPTLSAELMLALVQRAGHRIRILETSGDKAVVEGVRRDDPDYPCRAEFTIDEARAAGVTGKDNWKKYPAAMLRARAISALCRMQFADVLMGASYTPEELGAHVDEEGNVIDDPVSAYREMDHRDALDEIGRLLAQIPEDRRPPDEKVWPFAEVNVGNAKATAARLQQILDEMAGEGAGAGKPPIDVEPVDAAPRGRDVPIVDCGACMTVHRRDQSCPVPGEPAVCVRCRVEHPAGAKCLPGDPVDTRVDESGDDVDEELSPAVRLLAGFLDVTLPVLMKEREQRADSRPNPATATRIAAAFESTGLARRRVAAALEAMYGTPRVSELSEAEAERLHDAIVDHGEQAVADLIVGACPREVSA
jgi:hypothetical protein